MFCLVLIALFTFYIIYIFLGYLPSSRSECPLTLLLPLLCHFFEFSISVLHHPVHEFLSRYFPSPLFLSLPLCSSSIISLCRKSPLLTCPIQFFCLVLIMSIK